jgi:hypothetical protein
MVIHLPGAPMPRTTRITAAIAVAVAAAAAVGLVNRVQARQADEAGVRAALEHYLQGHATGDGAHMRAAFHSAARLFWVRGDTLATRTAEDYAAGFTGRPAPDEAQRRRWIERVEITGNAAIGVVILDYPQTRFTDYMSLLRIGGEWRIVNKTFVAEPKPAPER